VPVGRFQAACSSWWVTGLLALAVLGFALCRSARPFGLDQDTQRVQLARRSLSDILLHRDGDTRIPEGYYVVLHAATAFGVEEWMARLPSAVFAALSAAAMHRLSLACFQPEAALLAAVLSALSPGIAAQASETGPVEMFVFFAIASFYLLLRLSERGGRLYSAAYALAVFGLSQSSYFAPLALLPQLGWLALGSPAARRNSYAGVAAGLLLGLPSWLAIAGQLPSDYAQRQLAHAFPALVWGDVGPREYWSALAHTLAPAYAGATAACLAAFGAFDSWREPRKARALGLWMAWLIVPVSAGFVLIHVMRIKGYYFAFAAPPLAALAAVGVVSLSARMLPKAPSFRPLIGAAFAACYAAAFAASGGAAESPRADIADVVSRIRSSGSSRTVAFDPHFLYSLFTYYSASDPVRAWSACRRGRDGGTSEDPFMECDYEGWKVSALVNTADFPPDWRERSVRRLSALRRSSEVWYLEDPDFLNPDVVHALDRCRKEAFPRHTLWHCPPT
jgi:hypothetical protein